MAHIVCTRTLQTRTTPSVPYGQSVGAPGDASDGTINAPCGCSQPRCKQCLQWTQPTVLCFGALSRNMKFDTYWTIGMTSGDAEGQLPSTVGMPEGNDICSGIYSPTTNWFFSIRNRHSAQCFGWRGIAGFDRTSHHSAVIGRFRRVFKRL